MKRNWMFTTALGLLLALCGPEAATARPQGYREDRRPVFSTPYHRNHLRVPIRIPVVVPWHLRQRHEFGFVYGLHGGYHWAPGIGWHNLLHRGYYRPGESRVFVPASGWDWRFRGRF